ncbi:hypothetical protein J2X54_001699 [Duganella sp. 3397]|uniref:hypothetical protein n=1 Tax=Duganella sp. 3397 TaxID=2817732 RepID=UPI00285C5831|nr:hypothetical protein [Duganella sp. 3397]MDR7049251.1 hypothetical protein [Duganella sp. 3397]
MIVKKLFLGAATLLSLTLSAPARSGIDCLDKVTEVITHSNGRTFFVTQNACSNYWCEIKGDTTFVKQAYATLLLAKATSGTILFRWQNLTSCDAKNEGYAVPEFIVLK